MLRNNQFDVDYEMNPDNIRTESKLTLAAQDTQEEPYLDENGDYPSLIAQSEQADASYVMNAYTYGRPLTLFFKRYDGKTMTSTFEKEDTLDSTESQQKIQEMRLGTFSQLRFIYSGVRLETNKPLQDYNIHNESTICAVPLLRGD